MESRKQHDITHRCTARSLHAAEHRREAASTLDILANAPRSENTYTVPTPLTCKYSCEVAEKTIHDVGHACQTGTRIVDAHDEAVVTSHNGLGFKSLLTKNDIFGPPRPPPHPRDPGRLPRRLDLVGQTWEWGCWGGCFEQCLRWATVGKAPSRATSSPCRHPFRWMCLPQCIYSEGNEAVKCNLHTCSAS